MRGGSAAAPSSRGDRGSRRPALLRLPSTSGPPEEERSFHGRVESNYRQVPIAVVVPRDIEAGAEAVRVCARFGAPVLSRGGGTSLAGQCTNAAVVVDWTKHCDVWSPWTPGAGPAWSSPASCWTS